MKVSIKEFLYFIEFAENKTHHTVRSIKKDLTQLQEYLVEIEKTDNIDKITPLIVRGFIVNLQKSGISKRTINRKLSSFRGFFKYLLKNGKIKINPVDTIISPSFYVEKPDVLTLEEINKLRDIIPLNTTNGVRDRLILELLYSTGITSFEMLGLGEKVFNLDKREVYVMSGKTKRVVFFSQRTREFFWRYVELKKEKYGEKYNEDILFVNGSATRLSDRSLRRIITKYAIQAGLEKIISPYTFRHTFGVYMLSKGMDLFFLKELMGHTTLESTRVYQQILNTFPIEY